MKKLLRIFISLFLLIASVGIALVFVWPSYQEFANVREEVEQKKIRIEQGQETILEFGQVLAEVARRREDFDKVESAFPVDAGIPALHDYIQQIAVSSGVLLEEISMVDKKKGKDEDVQPTFEEIVVEVQLRGSYEGAKSFLASARRSIRLLNVNFVSIDLASDGDDSSNLNIFMEMSAFSKNSSVL